MICRYNHFCDLVGKAIITNEPVLILRYEERVLESSIQVQEKERIILMRELLLTKKRALHTNGRRRCSICALPLSTRVRSVVYTCAHAAHVDCADRCGGVTLDNTGKKKNNFCN